MFAVWLDTVQKNSIRLKALPRDDGDLLWAIDARLRCAVHMLHGDHELARRKLLPYQASAVRQAQSVAQSLRNGREAFRREVRLEGFHCIECRLCAKTTHAPNR